MAVFLAKVAWSDRAHGSSRRECVATQMEGVWQKQKTTREMNGGLPTLASLLSANVI